MMNKSILRQQFLTQRRALPVEEITGRSLAIATLFWAGNFLNNTPNPSAQGLVHTFLPVTRQNEVDTWPIIHRIWQDFPGVQTAVPVADVRTNRLDHYVLTPASSLAKNQWGIPEPQPDNRVAIDSKKIDVVLVPLVLFDQQGHRVGYGRGYYDRFLVECRPDCLKIGLSLFGPVARIADTEPTDVRLDSCVTPEQLYFF